MRLIIVGLLFFSTLVSAKTLEGIEFADEVKIGEQTFKLNGLGLRTKRKMLMDFKIYVAGLYLKALSKDPTVILASKDPKRLKLVFIRDLEKKVLAEAWREGFTKNCGKNCEAAKPALDRFNELMTDVKKGGALVMDIMPDGVRLNEGAEKIGGAEFSQSLLAIFIGAEPATPALKAGLLGN